MRKALISILLFSFCCAVMAQNPKQISVLQWNVWQEGTVVDGGYKAIVDEIVRLNPDFVTFSEVRNYNQTKFYQRITESLKERGKTYYSFYSYDSGLLSKFPITDSMTVFSNNEDHGSIYRLTTSVSNQKYAVYTAHLDYLNCAYYNARGYDGVTWKECTVPNSVDELLQMSDKSYRDDAIRKFLAQAKCDIEEGYTVVLGGDFNEPSHRDWIEATKNLYDHHGLVVPWTVTSLLEEHSFTDAFREVYPDVLKYPGFTYPVNNVDVPVKQLSWAPKADERERIDFIFYHGDLKPVTASLLGPEGLIIRGVRDDASIHADAILPAKVYPSDHKGLFVVFDVVSD